MTLLAAFALFDFLGRDSSRMIMTFYTVADGKDLIEERAVKNADHEDTSAKVAHYVEEVLLGPLSHEAAGFFPIANLQSCIVSSDTAYIGLPTPVVWAGIKDAEDRLTIDAARSLDTLKEDIKRNFRSIENVVLFIDGRETAE
jgi:hypothetical protein